MNKFKTKTYGKWIMAGEHAVLRGSPALAFPLLTHFLELEFDPNNTTLDVEFCGPHGEELKLLFYGVLENATSRLKVQEPLHGKFRLFNAVPVGAGLGASAALCGAIGKWCESQGWIEPHAVYEFSRSLEDLFHGESSGVDLAVSLSGQGIRFVRGGERRQLPIKWWPQLYLSYSGQRGITAECVKSVKQFIDHNPKQGTTLDARMREAVQLCEESLALGEPMGHQQLITGFKLARSCFEEWGLCPQSLKTHLNLLEESGAQAVKPTGSGGGGYVLSLWEQTPPAPLRSQLTQLSRPS